MLTNPKPLIICAFLFFTSQTFAQTYCSPSYPSGCLVGNNRITNVQIGTLNHTPPGCIVHDYTGLSTVITTGIPTQLTVISEGWCGVGAAVDLTQDGDFNDANEIMALPAYNGQQVATYNMTITIPAGTPGGNYRLRVFNRQANSGNGTPQDSPCGLYAYGSWDDYTLNVGIDLGPDTSICEGETITLNAHYPGATYLWNTGATTEMINVTTGGTYYVSATSSNVTESDTIVITVNPLPVVNLGNDFSINNGISTTLNAGNPGATYLWSTGAATQTINVSSPDTYYVTVTNSNGCSASDTIIISLKTVGINELDGGKDIMTIAPNPTRELIHINIPDERLLNTKAILTDANGKIVREVVIKSSSQIFSLSGLAKGIYFLKLKNGTSTKIIKE